MSTFADVAGVLERSLADTGVDKEQLIENAHTVECAIDTVILQGNLSVQWMKKLCDRLGIDSVLSDGIHFLLSAV